MAITKIKAVKATPELAIDYICKDKVKLEKIVEDFAENKTTIQISNDIFSENVLKYITKNKAEKKTIYKTISSTLNCSLQNANKEMQTVRQKFAKDNKNLLYHIMQNFGKKIDPQIANEIGRKLATELLSKYQCVISTHTNTDYTHNHIAFNATSFIDGQKYNDCLKTYAQIRKVSDRICKEYGLEVLTKTKDMKLIKYKDDKGKTKFFEPTQRKIKIRENQFSNANDYRDTKAFAEKEIFKKSNVQVIKEDIDRLLPYCTSYENLLKSMQEIGYKIKSKTVNGDFLKHISFQGSTQQKATRDSTIGEEYTREFLTKKINEQQIEIAQNNGELPLDEKPAVEKSSEKEIYKLGRIDIDKLDENIRYNVDLKREVKRSPAEKSVVHNTKYLHYEYKMCIKATVSFKPNYSNYKSQQLEKSINENLSALYFMEKNNIQSFSQIIEMKKILVEKHTDVTKTLADIKTSIDSVSQKVSMIESYNNLKRNILNTDAGYVQFEQENDIEMLKKYETVLKKHNLLDSEKQTEFINKAKKYPDIYKKMQLESERINNRIGEYDRLVLTIENIDKNISGSIFEIEKEESEDKNKNERKQNQKER